MKLFLSIGALCGMVFLSKYIYSRRKANRILLQRQHYRRIRRALVTLEEKFETFPNLNDTAECNKYFIEKVNEAFRHIVSEEMDKATDRLVDAIAVCSRPLLLLRCLSLSLSEESFKLLLSKLPFKVTVKAKNRPPE